MDTNNLSFHKIHGASNDFVVVDARQLEVDWAGLARRVCHRHRGIGADGVLLVQDSDDADFRMRLFNADGSEAEMCGNGIRCTHKFALDTGLSTSRRLTWETGGGRVTTELLDYDDGVARVQVDMGMPRFRPNEIPVDFRGEEVMEGAFSVNGADLALTCVSMGNPHAIAFVDSVDNFALDHIGPLVERHRAFPQRTNFEIAEVLAPNHLKM